MKYGRYEVVSEIGRGSMGVVYQAHDPQIDRLVALKVLREDRLSSEDYIRRFLKEATAVGRLSHRSIVTVFDIGQDHGTIYIAMELLEGTPLDELMKQHGLALEDVYRVGGEVAEALHYAHRKGIVHRDIKPANILCAENKEVKVTDFGIAHIDDPDGQQMTQAGEILGTPVYMSPEQVLGQPVDGRSDIYSLGVILYELTTGRRPFAGENLGALFNAITNDPVEPPARVNPEVPRWFSEIIMKALAREPAHRYSNGESLASDINRGRNRPPRGSAEPARPKRRSFLVPATAIVLLCLAGGAVYYFDPFQMLTGDQEPPASREMVADPGSEPGQDPVTDTPDREPADTVEPGGKKAVQEEESGKDVIQAVKEPDKPEVKTSAETPSRPASRPVAQGEQEQVPGGVTIDSGGDAGSGKELPMDDDMGIFSNSAFDSGQNSGTESLDEPVKPLVPKAVFSDGEPAEPLATHMPRVVPREEEKSPGTLEADISEKVAAEDKSQEKEVVREEVKVALSKKEPEPLVPDALLKMKSRPQGAEIYIDGEYKGKTPAELKVSAEKHEVKIVLEGHGDWKAQLDLRKGGEIPLSVRLLPD